MNLWKLLHKVPWRRHTFINGSDSRSYWSNWGQFETNKGRTFKFGAMVSLLYSFVSLKFGTNWSSVSGTTHTTPKTLNHIFEINKKVTWNKCRSLKFHISVFCIISFVSPKFSINWSSSSAISLRPPKI